jgi:hypothetical protein
VSVRNIYRDAVVRALTTDGWTITDDPLKLSYGDRELFVDLGAERATLGAEKAGRTIAVEIQSFLGRSPVRDLEEALGQYDVYRAVLEELEPDRRLYLAVTTQVHENLLSSRFGEFIVSRLRLSVLVFDDEQERISQWIEPSATG